MGKPSDSKRGKGTADRDKRGRFQPGHTVKSPGNPQLRRLGELQAAARDALTADELRAILRKMGAEALRGDAACAKVVLDRVLGRAKEAPHDANIELPETLDDAESINLAMSAVARAAAEGSLPTSDAGQLVSILERVADSVVLRQMEERLASLEAER